MDGFPVRQGSTSRLLCADIKDAEKEKPRMGVSIVLAKGFEAQHCFGLTHGICAGAVSVKGFVFGDMLMPKPQHPR